MYSTVGDVKGPDSLDLPLVQAIVCDCYHLLASIYMYVIDEFKLAAHVFLFQVARSYRVQLAA